MSKTADITIIGAGLLETGQLTRQAEEALRAARVVFCSTSNKNMDAHVRALNPNAQLHLSELHEYKLGMYRPRMYQRMAQKVVEAGKQGPGVVVLAPGSAAVVDLVSQFVCDFARASALSVQMVPGISSIESVLTEVGYDVSSGLQVILAQKLVLHDLELNPSMASIVLQPAYFDTLFFVGAPLSRMGRFEKLEHQLARTLSPEAPMALVITPTDLETSAQVLWFRLGSFGQIGHALSPKHTLFIPPERSVDTNVAFAQRIASWDFGLSQLELNDQGSVMQQKADAYTGQTCDLAPALQAESAVLAARWQARER